MHLNLGIWEEGGACCGVGAEGRGVAVSLGLPVGRAVRLCLIVSPVSSEIFQAITETSGKARETLSL